MEVVEAATLPFELKRVDEWCSNSCSRGILLTLSSSGIGMASSLDSLGASSAAAYCCCCSGCSSRSRFYVEVRMLPVSIIWVPRIVNDGSPCVVLSGRRSGTEETSSTWGTVFDYWVAASA